MGVGLRYWSITEKLIEITVVKIRHYLIIN